MTPDQILLAIKDLQLPEALAYLAANKILNLTKKGFESVRKAIQKKTAKKKVGFVPNKDENTFLKRVAEREYFREFGSILPNHKYSDFIRVGYLIAHLNKLGGQNNRQRVIEIRSSICQRPNGVFLIKIVNLVTTGAVVPVIDYLSELKKQKYDSEHIADIFNEIMLDWKKYAYFVKATTKMKEIITIIKRKVANDQRLIMIFSYGSAKDQTTKAVAQILKDKITEAYFYESKNNKEGDKEVHSSTFTLIESFNGTTE